MTNNERAIAFLKERVSHFSYNSALIDGIVAYGIECASAEVERRRVAQREAAALAGQVAAMRGEAEKLLIGGNHLASALIGFMEMKHPPHDTSIGEARNFFRNVDHFDVWVGWAALMKFRDALAQPPSAIEARVAAGLALAEHADDRRKGYTPAWVEQFEELLAHYRAAKEGGDV